MSGLFTPTFEDMREIVIDSFTGGGA